MHNKKALDSPSRRLDGVEATGAKTFGRNSELLYLTIWSAIQSLRNVHSHGIQHVYIVYCLRNFASRTIGTCDNLIQSRSQFSFHILHFQCTYWERVRGTGSCIATSPDSE